MQMAMLTTLIHRCVSHEEPVDDGLLSATVTVEFDVGTDPDTPDAADAPVNPYLASVGLSGDAETPSHPDAPETNPYLDAVGVDGASIDPAVPPDVAPDILEGPGPDDPHALPDDPPLPDPLDDIVDPSVPQQDDDGTQNG